MTCPNPLFIWLYVTLEHDLQESPFELLQGMVVSLATDKGVWDAVLANEKIKEFRRNFSAPTSEGTFANIIFDCIVVYIRSVQLLGFLLLVDGLVIWCFSS